jgi:hypothetical protein
MSVAGTITKAIPLPKETQALADLGAALDAADEDARLQWMRSLPFKQQERLYELAEGNVLRASDFAAPDGSVTICEGKNGLLLFTRFQKRFARVDDEIVGYNYNDLWIVPAFVGHGHFVVEDSPDVPGEVWVNYCKVPSGQHPEFPKVHDNNGLFSRLAYGDMIDILRRVSRNIVIGHSFKPSGKWGLNAGQYFVLHLTRHQ